MKPLAVCMLGSLLSLMSRTGWRLLGASLLVGGFLLNAQTANAVESGPLLAFGARIAGDDARTRVVVEFDRKPDFSLHYVADPVRVVVDLPETAFGLKAESLEPRGLFDAIRYGGMGRAIPASFSPRRDRSP